MKLLFLASVLLSTNAFATNIREVEITNACEESLKEYALNAEYNYLAQKGETLASKLEAEVMTSYWPAEADMVVSVRVEDKADGRYVSYRAKVSKVDALACKIKVKRSNSTACRYSTGEGPDGLNEINGLKFVDGKTLSAKSDLSDLEKAQIKAFLGNDSNEPVEQLIENTDDGELSTGTLTLPSGKVLSYFGAYGGDNPFGIFFVKGTTRVAGDNSDGSVCIK